MKRTLLVCAVLLCASLFVSTKAEAASVDWQHNYEKAAEEARAENKPMVLLFTGSDWCPWCVRLKQEVLDTSAFADDAGNSFVFVELDFPMRRKLPDNLAKQNQALQKQYNVQAFPTVIVVDQDGRKLGEVRYNGNERPADFANKLKATARDATGFHATMEQLDTLELSDGQLHSLYYKAQDLGREDYRQAILARGVAQERGTFFLSEKYRELVQSNCGMNDEVCQIRQELLARDAQNEEGCQRMVAVLDFQQQACNEAVEPCDAAAPLVAYLEEFGAEDPDYRWRVEMALAQYYLSRGDRRESQRYAQSSLIAAPDAVRPEIQEFLQRASR